MALPDLSKMKDEDYKLLSSRDLARYNVELPQLDYEKPYFPIAYPTTKFKLVELADGGRELEYVECPDAKTAERLKKDGWMDSPTACGVETHPAAPNLRTGRSSIPLPRKDT